MLKVRDTDRGAKKRIRQIRSMGANVAIGILSADASKAHGGTTTLEVAIWNEFGTRRIPERSFLRAWFDDNQERAEKMWLALHRLVVAGKITQEKALNLFGQKCVGEIQQRIADRIPPPNANSTIRQKRGSDVPLIDTGQLRSSISYAIR